MLKELRDSDPMLMSFRDALTNPNIVGRTYSAPTIKSYSWHARNFVKYCHLHKTTPKKISTKGIKKYLHEIQKDVKTHDKSRGFFLQACTSLEIFYFTALKNPRKADAIPAIRQSLVA